MQLSESFLEIMAYVCCLLKTVESAQPPYDEVKQEISRLLSASEERASRGLVGKDDFHRARFAICAWVDEAILSSWWLHKTRWLDDQLQRLHYDTTAAGEEFFERLDAIGPEQRELREVYYLCLALGFAGRYCNPGDERLLEQIKTLQLKILLGNPVELPSPGAELFPAPQPCPDPAGPAPKAPAASRLAAVVCLTAPVLLFGILYLVYRFTLSGIAENFLRTVTN